MAEILSPNPTKPKAPVVTRLQSPTNSFLGSNDDQLERAQARAARAAAIRRKYLTTNDPPQSPSDHCLDREQIVELFQNCIKLASENKINQKNTWDLKLIDHLSEIINVETENNGSETNFQKASCTLEAGVKIYSLRVDSVHAEAYKVLGRIIRAGGEDEQELPTAMVLSGTLQEVCDTGGGSDEGCSKKEKQIERKVFSLLSTLESSFDALNVKKFDVAFAVDPLYHQTSAQFDEGGAKGLLLNNLGVYGGCKVLFDSLEVPSKCMLHSIQDCDMDKIDLSFAREYIEQMLMNLPAEHGISPTLRKIVCQFHNNSQKVSDILVEAQEFVGTTFHIGDSDLNLDSNSFQNFEAGHTDNRGADVNNESFTFGDEAFADHHEDDNPCTSFEPDADRISEEIDVFLFQGSGFTTQNAWAGPEHWKYRNRKEDVTKSESRSDLTARKSPSNRTSELDIDFMRCLDEYTTDFFAPPKSPKMLLLPANVLRPERKLPEDCHYQPENLIRLFLLPSVMCFGKGIRKKSDDNSWEPDRTSQEQAPPWDNGSVFGGHFDDVCSDNDVDDSSKLVSHPRQVNKIDVHYDKTSKQVDVHMLKETLWDHIQESTRTAEMVYEGTISFKDILATFPDDCEAAPAKDISPHLFFICLLHLANEHSLSIYECQTLDDFKVQLPSSCRS